MEPSGLTDHISRRFNKDIEDLRNTVLTMGGLVESQLSLAIKAIVSGDSELGLKVAAQRAVLQSLERRADVVGERSYGKGTVQSIMRLESGRSELRITIADARAADQRIGLVPTMGALHEGHLALVRHANKLADRVIVCTGARSARVAGTAAGAAVPGS